MQVGLRKGSPAEQKGESEGHIYHKVCDVARVLLDLNRDKAQRLLASRI
jgi:hypothetical protein